MKFIQPALLIFSLLIIGCTPTTQKTVEKQKPPEKPGIKPVEAVQILHKGPGRVSTRPYIPGSVLLETAWNQGFPYNKQLPRLGRERVVSGCVNTALAQVLYYYRYPLSARGIFSHHWNNRYLTANLNRNYNWNIIPASITAETPDYQVDELAALFRDLGIVNGTNFNISRQGGSGASFNTVALAENLGFSTGIKQMKNNDPAFITTIRNEIDHRRVVLLSISGKPSGHMTVVDGYRTEKGRLKFHINMGWGGSDNSFYDLSKPIVPLSKKDKNSLASDITFLPEMTIYYNVVPCSDGDCYRNLEAEDGIHGMKIWGRFNSKKDRDIYKGLFLSGPTVFKGDRGYSNQAFYIMIYSDKHRLLAAEAPKTKAFRINLKPDRYDIAVSLCKQKPDGGSFCYFAKPKHLDYTVDIRSRPVSVDEKQRILSRDEPPKIRGQYPNMILRTGFDEHRIRIDASDPDADQLTLRAFTNPYDANIKLALNGNILGVSPNEPASNTTSKITIQAVSRQKTVEKSFRILFSADSVSFGREFDVNGKFAGQDSRNRHKVILQGNCVIRGYNGYKNQAFYTTVTDSRGKALYPDPDNTTIRYHFPRGIYYVEAMLRFKQSHKTGMHAAGTIWTYKYRKGKGDAYNINVSCPEFNESIALLERDNQDLPPRITTALPDLILGAGFSPVRIPVDTLDENGDAVTLSVITGGKGLKAVIQDNQLNLYPDTPQPGTRMQVTVTALSNGLRTSKSFTVFFQKETIVFGKRFEMNGRILGQTDTRTHPVILGGKCRISGYNGYNNQAFYTTVLDRNRSSLLPLSDKGIVRTFKPGIYYINAALRNDSGRYYTYKPGKGDQYKLSIECPGMDLTTENIAGLLGY